MFSLWGCHVTNKRLNTEDSRDELINSLSGSCITLVRFVLKRITFATDTPIVYTTPALSRLKTETFTNASDPVLV